MNPRRAAHLLTLTYSRSLTHAPFSLSLRYKTVTVTGEGVTDLSPTYYDHTCSGYLARLVLHENDHLNGILYCDRAEEGSVISYDEMRQLRDHDFAKKTTDGLPSWMTTPVDWSIVDEGEEFGINGRLELHF